LVLKGSYEGVGTPFPHGINLEVGGLHVADTPITLTAAELNALSGVGTTSLQVQKLPGTATNGAIVFTAGFNIAGFIAQGFNNANAPMTIATAVISTNTLTITPSAAGTTTDEWYVLCWA